MTVIRPFRALSPYSQLMLVEKNALAVAAVFISTSTYKPEACIPLAVAVELDMKLVGGDRMMLLEEI